MRLSSTSLFHFAKKEEYLLDTLERGFIPRYCLEEITYMERSFESDERYEAAFPMKCFCDIRLSQTKNHSKKYGEYIIGMKKQWAINSGAAPVTYVTRKGPDLGLKRIMSDLRSLLENSTRKKTLLEISEVIESASTGRTIDAKSLDINNPLDVAFILRTQYVILMQIGQFFKPVNGLTWTGEGYEERYFYDEREWRQTPVFKGGYRPQLTREEFLNKEFIEREQNVLRNRYQYGVKFSEEDINWIIVPKPEDVEPFQVKLVKNHKRLNPKKLIRKVRNYKDILDKTGAFEDMEEDI